MDRFSSKNTDSEWLPISDLMSVLMMVFLIISVSYMLQVEKAENERKKITEDYINTQEELYKDLKKEFNNDLKSWNAQIDRTKLSIRFLVPDDYKVNSPKIFFNPGSSVLTNYGEKILNDFFPRFRKIIYRYKNSVEELRIEGHTSSDWIGLNENRAYYNNMKLSQDRTRNVLEFTLESVQDADEKAWFREYLSSNGLSSSKVIKDSLGIEDYIASRRVEFRIKTRAEESLRKINKLK